MKKESVAIGGAVLAALGASLCCIGPLLFVVIGIGAFSAAAVFERGRPYLLAAAVLALAFGFYCVYFRRESCEPGDACATKPVTRAGRLGLWIASLAVLAFALSPFYVGYISAAMVRGKGEAVTRPAGDSSSNSLESVVIEVEGMDCASCEMPIKAALEKNPGVRSATVSYERKKAEVIYDGTKTDINQIKQAIDSTGYKAK